MMQRQLPEVHKRPRPKVKNGIQIWSVDLHILPTDRLIDN